MNIYSPPFCSVIFVVVMTSGNIQAGNNILAVSACIFSYGALLILNLVVKLTHIMVLVCVMGSYGPHMLTYNMIFLSHIFITFQ